MNIVYGRNGKSIRPSVLRRSTYIRPGQLFSEKNIEQTYSAFASLRALRNVNIRFTEVEERDTMKFGLLHSHFSCEDKYGGSGFGRY